MKKVLSIVLVFAFLISFASTAEATESKSANFIGGYSVTGNGAVDIVNIALKQEGRTGSQFGYTEQWCADFVSDCAKLVGQSSAIPFNGKTSTLKTQVKSAGGYETSSPQAGDLCFIDWTGNGSIDHVEIVYDVDGSKIYTIGGNSGHPSGTNNLYNRYVYKHKPINSSYNLNNGLKFSVVRPNYQTVHTHNYTTYVAGGAATCETQGYTTKSCSCGQTITTYSPEKGHDFSLFSHHEESHPHYKIYRCSRCSKTQKNNETSFDASCVQCNPSAFCANLGDDFYGVILNTGHWKPISKTDGTNDISLQTENGSSMQKWRFQRQSDGAYVISSCYDGTVLEMTDGKREVAGETLSAHNGFWGGNYQQWYLIPQGNGYIFLNKHYPNEQWTMDLSGDNSKDGMPIISYPRNNSSAQIWSVYNREEVQLQPAKLSVSVINTKATFSWPDVYGASSYSLKISTEEMWNNGTGPYITVDRVKSGYSVELPAGNYYAYIDSEDYYSYIMSNVVTININPKYSLSYDSNGGSDAPSTQSGATSYTISDAIPVKEGYKFLGWAETNSATGASYQPGDTINISKNTTLYAVWQVSFICPNCGEEFNDEALYNEHTASCEGGTVTLFGLFMSFLISIFGYIIMLPLLPFMIFA